MFFCFRSLSIVVSLSTQIHRFLAIPILPDYPTTTKWLTEKEVQIAEHRLIEKNGTIDSEDVDANLFYGIKLAVKDPKVWLLALSYHCTIMGLSFR